MKLILAALTVIISSFISASAQEAAGPWQQYAPKGEGFNMMFPCAAAMVVEEDGANKRHECSFERRYYAVSTADMAAEFGAEGLDSFQKGLIEGMKGTLESSAPLKIDGNAGRSLLIRVKGGTDDPDLVFRASLFNIGNRVYVLAVAGVSDPASADTDKFLGSFRSVK